MTTPALYTLHHELSPHQVMAVAEFTPGEAYMRNKRLSARREPVQWITDDEWQKRKPSKFDNWIMEI